jgi:Putative heavy-metal-binding
MKFDLKAMMGEKPLSVKPPLLSFLRMERKMRVSIAVMVGGVAAGCSPFVPVTNVAAVDPQTRAAAIQVRVLPLGMQLPAGTKILQPVQAYSCKHLMTDPPATQGDAMQQLQLRALELKANAVVNVTFDTRGTDTFGTNCWQTVIASGFAASLP